MCPPMLKKTQNKIWENTHEDRCSCKVPPFYLKFYCHRFCGTTFSKVNTTSKRFRSSFEGFLLNPSRPARIQYSMLQVVDAVQLWLFFVALRLHWTQSSRCSAVTPKGPRRPACSPLKSTPTSLFLCPMSSREQAFSPPENTHQPNTTGGLKQIAPGSALFHGVGWVFSRRALSRTPVRG